MAATPYSVPKFPAPARRQWRTPGGEVVVVRFLIAVLLSNLVAVVGCQTSPSPAQPAPALTTSVQPPATVLYTNPVYHWSITYPSSYDIDTAEPEWIQLRASNPPRQVGVHSFQTDKFDSVDEMVDAMLDHDERYLETQGLTMVVVSRRPITLPNDVSAIDVVKEMRPGGKSRDIYVLIGRQGYSLSAETYIQSWDQADMDFDRIINSFTVESPH
ncbi:hypothetical protein ORI20_03935 [Mycobacterium sp. CVI_P3]|uniref:PsbP C-terminal domain-containing protein n=1 Tax=Mycobacterium pinniadriaticum TaxID=2994102 RepID=A0ABT3S9M7_9MYCO|nr:hypothetical protein [Mycobacterium pinniadriaticum]MCX2929409.1 hypothetical protein [Mycobacterium pinniadriaticum]MCX2935833.1 hypothetical protein [Mycobacterium pinniadriaticum]